VTRDSKEDREITVFVDTLPNLIRMGQTKIVEGVLKERFEKNLPEKIARYGRIPYLIVQLGPFNSYLHEARNLYIDEYYRGAVALCGMTVEALCYTLAMERVNDDESLKKQLTDPSEDCRKKIELLKKYLRIEKSSSLLHQVLDARREIIHLHKKQVLSEGVLDCINKLHLAVIAEYGLIPAKEGKVSLVSEEYVDGLARDMKLTTK